TLGTASGSGPMVRQTHRGHEGDRERERNLLVVLESSLGVATSPEPASGGLNRTNRGPIFTP
ncbi:MAG: hypothetical protein R3324_20010, partial [Halobacteriales archaeon]|nr:hypothetical protein [Halobacteriales archaeon]